MGTHRTRHSQTRWIGLAFALAASMGHAQSDGTARTSRFAVRATQAEIAPNVSASGRFGAVAQAQSRHVDGANKRFALRSAEQCVAGVPTPERIFVNGFE